jgi:hypothetical protein
MRRRIVSRLAWALCLVTVPLALAGLTLAAFNDPSGINKFSVTGAVLGATFPLVGALVASRHPQNPIGWIFCAIGVSQGLDTFDTAYASYALLTHPGSLPAGDVMAWLSNWTFAPGFGLLLTFSMLLFPDGHTHSAAWRPVAWLSAVAIALATLPVALATWRFRGPDLVFGVQSRAGGSLSLAVTLQAIGIVLILVLGLAAAVSVVLRFRTARGMQRQQLKWFTYAAVVGVSLFVAAFPLPVNSFAGIVVAIVVSPLIPIATGVAILRYRLYDIDVIINRTLVYVVLTALLALVYVGGVVGVGGLVREASGERSNDLVIAASTLAVATLFRPVRSRVQSFIDRRFYRRKYDAARTMEAFAALIRDQVSLEAVTTELQSVVRTTMQPSHVSVWLKR